MADTEQIRKWYHAGVVLNHAQRGTAGYQPRCNHNQPKVAFPNDSGGHYNEPVHPLTVEAWKAYVAAMDHHGETMTKVGGVNQCRNIAGTDWPSLHAYLCAVDLPPNSRKSNAFIRDIEAIRTKSGAQVFRNLAGDRMHDQINGSPAALASGIDWTTVPGQGDDDMAYLSDDQQKQLAHFLKVLGDIGSNTGFVAYIIPWFRKLSGLTPEQLAELEESDEIAALEARINDLADGPVTEAKVIEILESAQLQVPS